MSARTGRPNGRPPKPTELKVITGNPGKRPLRRSPGGTKPSRVPGAPTVLRKAGADAWTIYWTHGRAWLAETDRPLVTRLCRLIDAAADLEAVIDAEGLTHRNRSRRSSVHHSFNNLLGIYKAIADLESRAGFTPTDRARLEVPAGSGDELDAWEARRSRG